MAWKCFEATKGNGTKPKVIAIFGDGYHLLYYYQELFGSSLGYRDLPPCEITASLLEILPGRLTTPGSDTSIATLATRGAGRDGFPVNNDEI